MNRNANTIEDIDKNRLYNMSEILMFFGGHNIPNSRGAFYIMKDKGYFDDTYFIQLQKGGHLKIGGANLIRLIKKIVNIKEPLKGGYAKQMQS